VTLCCVDTPIAATVAVTTGGVSLLICKNIFFVSLLPLAVRGRSNTPQQRHTLRIHTSPLFLFLIFHIVLHKPEPISATIWPKPK
jgi:hypothetical protein